MLFREFTFLLLSTHLFVYIPIGVQCQQVILNPLIFANEIIHSENEIIKRIKFVLIFFFCIIQNCCHKLTKMIAFPNQ